MRTTLLRQIADCSLWSGKQNWAASSPTRKLGLWPPPNIINSSELLVYSATFNHANDAHPVFD